MNILRHIFALIAAIISMCAVVLSSTLVGCDDSANDKRTELREQREQRADEARKEREISHAKSTLENKLWSLRERIGIVELGIASYSSLENNPTADSLGESGKANLESLRKQQAELQKQLDYIETYNRLPPESFFTDP